LLPPIEGKNAFIGDAPVRQMPVDTKRYVEGDVSIDEPLYRRVIQMVVVVVRDHDGVQAGKLIKRKRRWIKSFDARPPERGGAISKYWVEQHSLVVDFHQERGVSE